MTIERHDPEVGIKVVPMVIEGEDAPAEQPPEPVERRKTAVLGISAAALSGLTVVALVVAMVLATAGDFGTATIVGYVSIGTSALAVIGGIVAVVLGLGRRIGIAAMALGIAANPIVLLYVLRFFSGFRAG